MSGGFNRSAQHFIFSRKDGVLNMKYRTRTYYSAEQKAEMWDRWQRGEVRITMFASTLSPLCRRHCLNGCRNRCSVIDVISRVLHSHRSAHYDHAITCSAGKVFQRAIHRRNDGNQWQTGSCARSPNGSRFR